MIRTIALTFILTNVICGENQSQDFIETKNILDEYNTTKELKATIHLLLQGDWIFNHQTSLNEISTDTVAIRDTIFNWTKSSGIKELYNFRITQMIENGDKTNPMTTIWLFRPGVLRVKGDLKLDDVFIFKLVTASQDSIVLYDTAIKHKSTLYRLN